MFKWFADLITYDVLRLTKETHLADSMNFFFYDVPKIYFMLICVIFFVAFLRTYLPPERIRKIVAGKSEVIGNILVSFFGIFMPFCTCSAIPLFMGMLQSGIPLGVTMSFLIASPMINEIAVVMLWGLFGWQVSLIYILSGMTIATLAGYLIGRMKMERFVSENISSSKFNNADMPGSSPIKERIIYSFNYSIDVFKYVWIYVMVGIGIGALIHGYVPGDLLTQYAGRSNPFAVIIATIIGVPIYANCAGAIPVAQALMLKGLPLGTSLAFLMAVTGLSLPEFLILRSVIKPRLLYTFFGIVALGIILTGYLFNFIF
ncbi:MAG: permease [Candidatus Saganbacteria bacterium]|nr:permease [Candidatus Saganbacteria bacterium]